MNKLNDLQQALALTKQMLSLAKDLQWDSLAPLEKQRQLLLDRVFPLEETAAQQAEITAVLPVLIDTNEQLVAQCQQGKQQLQSQLRDARFTQKAVNAYQSS